MTSTSFRTDVAIIGAGPVGLFAIFECGMLGMASHVIDVLDVAGGQCTALYPEKPIYDIPGFPQILGSELIDRLQTQAAPFHPVYHLGQQVTELKRLPTDRWLLGTSAGVGIDAAVVILAAGVGSFGPNRPPLAHIQHFEQQPAGSGVQYLVRRRDDYRDRRVVIAGGGDSAVDWAVSLAEIAASVAVVHRRDKFRAAPDSVQKLRRLAAAGTIELVVPFQLAGLEGEGKQLTGVVVRDLDGQTRTLAADVLLPFFGLSQDLGPIARWGLNLYRNHVAIDQSTCSAGSAGLFAIGDIASYPGKLKLILTGFAEAAAAAHAAHPVVHPGEALHFEYSTTKGVPAAS